jgi:hypothetical protein
VEKLRNYTRFDSKRVASSVISHLLHSFRVYLAPSSNPICKYVRMNLCTKGINLGSFKTKTKQFIFSTRFECIFTSSQTPLECVCISSSTRFECVFTSSPLVSSVVLPGNVLLNARIILLGFLKKTSKIAH